MKQNFCSFLLVFSFHFQGFAGKERLVKARENHVSGKQRQQNLLNGCRYFLPRCQLNCVYVCMSIEGGDDVQHDM